MFIAFPGLILLVFFIIVLMLVIYLFSLGLVLPLTALTVCSTGAHCSYWRGLRVQHLTHKR